MKYKLSSAIVVFALLLISCKNDKKEVLEQQPEKEQTFDVTLNMVVNKDDNFQLFYTDNETEGFDELKSIWLPVKGLDSAQNIVFHLPKDIIPTNIRLDLGNNDKQLPMKLNSFKMEYFGNSYELKDTLISKNFVIGEQLKYDKNTSILTPAQGNAKTYDPLLFPQDNLKEEIVKMVQQQ